jgi:hypothetical protein
VSYLFRQHSDFLGALKNTHRTAGASYGIQEGRICDIILTLGIYIITAAREYMLLNPTTRHLDCSVFRQLWQRLLATRNVTPMEYVKVGPSQTLRTPANEDIITKGVE